MTVSETLSEFSGLKVMVIDDSKTIRRSAESLLQKAGCEVLTADNGFVAYNQWAASRYHLYRYHDAASGWLSNLCLSEKQS